MKHRLFNLLAAVSLVLCIAFAMAFVLSLRGWQYPPLGMRNTRVNGSVEYLVSLQDGRFSYEVTEWAVGPFTSIPTTIFHWTFRLWPPILLAGILPAVWLLRRGSRRAAGRAAMGLCTRCGYNLTGNVSGVCPECGKPIVATVVKTNAAP